MYGDVGSFINDFHNAMFFCGLRIILGRLRFLVPRKKMEKTFKSSHEFLDFYIAKAFNEKKIGSNGGSLVQGLVQQTEDRVEVRNQTLQNLMAASDTISILLSNTLFLLSRHPEIWKELRPEILEKISEEPTIESLKSPGLLRNVLFEGKLLNPHKLSYIMLTHILQHSDYTRISPPWSYFSSRHYPPNRQWLFRRLSNIHSHRNPRRCMFLCPLPR